MSADDIRYILGTAETMKYILNQKDKKTPHLQGKSVIMLFYEQSARAKLAYELAAQYLSANVIDMTNTVHSIEKESLQDIGQLMDQMGGRILLFCVIPWRVRRGCWQAAWRLLSSMRGDGFNENPGQSLLDLLTIREQKGGFEGLKVAIIGDLLHSRVSKSNIWGLTKLGAEVCVSGYADADAACHREFRGGGIL